MDDMNKLEKTVLIIDDERLVNDTTKLLLEQNNYNILQAFTGNQGLNIFNENSKIVDCIILDLSLPDIPGEEVLQRLRELSSTLKIIISSGTSDPEVEEQVIDLGANSFLAKPFRINELFNEIEK
jgi:DNA-binding response OmpR family regulator